MKLAIAILLLLGAAIAASDQGGFLSLHPAAKDHNLLSDDCVIASSATRPFADICLEECGWNENKTFTEIAELFEVHRFLTFLISHQR